MRKMLEFINVVSFTLYIGWVILPIVRDNLRGGIWNTLVILIFVIWAITATLLKPHAFRVRKSNIYIFYLVIWISIYLLYVLIDYGTDNLAHLQIFMNFWTFIFVFEFYKSYLHNNRKLVSIVVSVIGIFLFVTYITTVRGLIDYPTAIRTISHTGSEFYSNLNIGGYDFLYSLILLIPFYVFLMKNESTAKKYKLKYLLIILGILLLSFLSNFFTAVVFGMLGLILGMLVSKHKKTKVTYLYYLIIGVSIILLLLLPLSTYTELLVMIETQLQDGFLKIRLNELITLLSAQTLSGSSLMRSEFAMNSFNSFLENPLFGVGGTYYDAPYIIGAHSQWIDDLGRYGLFGFLPLLLLLWNFFSASKDYLKSDILKRAFSYTFFLFILLGFVNPTTSRLSIGVVVFIYAPLKLCLLDNKMSTRKLEG